MAVGKYIVLERLLVTRRPRPFLTLIYHVRVVLTFCLLLSMKCARYCHEIQRLNIWVNISVGYLLAEGSCLSIWTLGEWVRTPRGIGLDSERIEGWPLCF